MSMKVGATADGKLTAVDARTLIDGGAYSSFGLVTAYYSGQLLTLPAFAQGYRFKSTRLFTNKPPCGPSAATAACSRASPSRSRSTRSPSASAMDPIELRRKNLVAPHERSLNGMRVTSNGIVECLDRVEAASRWKERRARLPYGKGLGVAASAYISGTNYCIYPNQMPQSAVQLKVDRSGVVTVFSGQSEIGQGCDTLLAVLVADELGLDLGAVACRLRRHRPLPRRPRRLLVARTFMNGNAAIHAAQQVRAKLVEAVAEKLGVTPREILVTRGALCVAADPTRSIPVTLAIELAESKFGTLGAVGYYNTPELGGDYRGGTIGRLAGVLVHRARRRGRGRRRDGARRGQDHLGGARLRQGHLPDHRRGPDGGLGVHGAAEAILEEHVIGADGLHKGPNLLDYRIPTSLDVPDSDRAAGRVQRSRGPQGAPRRRARARSTRRSPRSPTPSSTRWACASTGSRSRPRASSPRYATSAPASRRRQSSPCSPADLRLSPPPDARRGAPAARLAGPAGADHRRRHRRAAQHEAGPLPARARGLGQAGSRSSAASRSTATSW